MVKGGAVREGVVSGGVMSNVGPVKGVLGDPDFWKGNYDVHMVDPHLTEQG